ncbi:hypothetical protein BKA69DRAFT_1108515 [Paraphysoderma sedebokerense]|nr:hypothetical protein BKA69DRAFT_1108515 [Paraphysoderma sedebokerense]
MPPTSTTTVLSHSQTCLDESSKDASSAGSNTPIPPLPNCTHCSSASSKNHKRCSQR